ncbi:nuclear transport factor 2 family protein [Natrarchaeobius halalkaliphilus]|uniref:Nuclear transport factor 2 family protein n=1 Tax=Natrarchaeobius halalkaliphilus TaxID=1679091 RepID=A0A3N6LSB7_9EURY|nr:nuclear transport factor 2 family protein [Natrarchaeobius halalkaliphilus]RQG92798.1 nuclear transport factor 2 family protein [Natrarchaeobius halalkaliphilus]
MEPTTLVRQYYDALDDHEYEALEEVLSTGFVQHRPDRTFEGRETFVRFMRDERPNPNTEHELDAIVDDGDQVAVRGRLIESGTTLFAFADFFDLSDGRIVRLETYSR